MHFITDQNSAEAANYTIGGKARNLFRLKEIALPVPAFAVIPQESFLDILPKKLDSDSEKDVQKFIRKFDFPEKTIKKIKAYFPEETLFAVRSSAIDEDGTDFSFAGQFESFLFVRGDQLAEKIKEVWLSSCSRRVMEYRKFNGLKHRLGIAVVIQEMVDADVAGVGFGINPISGNRKEKLISAVYGLGEGLVSGELNADNFIVRQQKIEQQLTAKTAKIVIDPETRSGTVLQEVTENMQLLPSLNDIQILRLAKILDQTAKSFGKAQDIEFAVKDKKIYLLQARPITNLNKIPDTSGEYILWDNSNIIESYPGVTTPLTFSFISKSYEEAYKLFCAYMGVHGKVIHENDRVFKNTLGLINGRVYYNLKTWYHMLAMLPGYSINARFMEKMMGVKESFDIPDKYRLSKGKAWWRIIKMIFSIYGRFLSLGKKRWKFKILLDQTISEYKNTAFEEKNANELMELYLNFEKKLINEWKAPLLNDFFAMIWFGMLQKRCEKYKVSSNPNIHNDLLCGSADIISTQPIHRSMELSSRISENVETKTLFIEKNERELWKILSTEDKYEDLKLEIDRYITDFGERCIGELKLETVSYTQDPSKFIKVLKSYVEGGITAKSGSGKIEEEIRNSAEKEVKTALKGKFYKQYKLNKSIRKTRDLVSSRENLRYERTRAFGIVRELFSQIGKRFYAEGIIESDRDIFYLTKEEIFAFIEGTSVNQDLKKLIALRKTEFAGYETQEIPSERFASYGTVYHANDFYSTDKVEQLEGDLKGIGCCPGRVKAKVRVILNPNEVNSLEGDILVTSSTDPGWVTLFPTASAIIVERGSLLSHSAIVSREMGIPCIVGVTGLLKTLKTGDVVEMDGSTGQIKVIAPEHE